MARVRHCAWTVQSAGSFAVAAALILLWRSRACYEIKAAGLAVGALLATPYIYMYDLVVLAVAIAFLLRLPLQRGFSAADIGALAAAGILILAFPYVRTQVGLAAVLIVAALVVKRTLADKSRSSARNCSSAYSMRGSAITRQQYRPAARQP